MLLSIPKARSAWCSHLCLCLSKLQKIELLLFFFNKDSKAAHL